MASRAGTLGLRTVALGYLALLIAVPVGLVLYRTFEHGLAAPINSLTSADGAHAFWLTLEIAAIAVAVNTVFGVTMALLLVRGRFHGKALLSGLIDLPLAVSPVVIGLALVLVFGREGWLQLPFQVIFSVPGIVLATIFVSLPFVVRETVPILRELGTDQEEAAATLGASAWQAFWRVTLPAIRWAVGYGVVLTTARALGEFGAVSVVSGRLVGQTETLTLRVQNEFERFDLTGAYAASALLAVMAIAVLLVMTALEKRRSRA